MSFSPIPGACRSTASRNWSSGWLPPVYQGTPFRAQECPCSTSSRHLALPKLSTDRLELLSQLNAEHKSRFTPKKLDLDARIASFGLAARMRLSATDALDLSQESRATQALYGLDNPITKSYGSRCLMARRLVERGVRFVQLFMAGQPWDTHANNAAGTRSCCEQTDLPVAGLLSDLKQRGLLEQPLVVWGGEFGRTPGAQGKDGRDHHPHGFTVWLAGGGTAGGRTYGAHRRLRISRRHRSLQRFRPACHDPPPPRPRLPPPSPSPTKAATSDSRTYIPQCRSSRDCSAASNHLGTSGTIR